MIRVSTTIKKSVVELVTYKKGKGVIVISRTYRFGHVDIDDAIEFPPNYNTEKGVDVLSRFSPIDHALIDCCSEEVEYRNVSKKDKTAIENSEFSLSLAVEGQNFTEFDNEWWFFGPLRVEQV
jgi:hypothetical protein